MSGTINLSLTQQLDEFGHPLSGGLLYIIQAGTVSTPQNAFQDTALTIPWPNPITLDAAGRIPQLFIADGVIKVRLQDKNGVVKFVADNLLVIGPSAGTSTGTGSVDATSVMQTGDIKIRYDNAIINGFVRCNGKTIGNASSGASELADPSAQALFLHLWNKDATLAVYSGGTVVTRGASAAADYASGRSIALPDGRGRLLGALSDMGSTDVGLFTGATFTKGNQTTLGSQLGVIRRGLTNTELPSHFHSAGISDPGHGHGASASTSVGISDPGHAHGIGISDGHSVTAVDYSAIQGGGTQLYGGNYQARNILTGLYVAGAGTGISASASTSVSIGGSGTGVRVNSSNGIDTTYSAGSGGNFDIANPMMLITIYLKL